MSIVRSQDSMHGFRDLQRECTIISSGKLTVRYGKSPSALVNQLLLCAIFNSDVKLPESTPKMDGSLHGKSIYKWMMTGGSPMTWETSICSSCSSIPTAHQFSRVKWMFPKTGGTPSHHPF